MRMLYHGHIEIEEALKHPMSLRGCKVIENGKVLETADEVRDYLRGQQALGRKVLPYGDCDNFDYQTGCQGHHR